MKSLQSCLLAAVAGCTVSSACVVVVVVFVLIAGLWSSAAAAAAALCQPRQLTRPRVTSTGSVLQTVRTLVAVPGVAEGVEPLFIWVGGCVRE